MNRGEKIYLKEMTYDMFHMFFKEYINDKDLYLDKNDFNDYIYSEERVNQYIQKQIDKNRIVLAIMYDDLIVGEIKIYDIIDNVSATLGITIINDSYKGLGIGTKAELLAIDYVFYTLNIPVLYADSIITNTRSQHVLEKVGFTCIGQDETKKYYKIEKR